MYVNQNCIGCSQCVAFCKYGAIVAKGKATITENCKNCGVCLSYCPMKAIEPEKAEASN